MTDVRVGRSLTIPNDEIRFSFSTSSGPGGQHANKVATRVTLEWNVDDSRALGPRQRTRIRTALHNRIDSAGVLRLSGDRYRSQIRNRDDVVERLRRLIAEALRPRKARVPTKPTKRSVERRLQQKRRRGEVKRRRRAGRDD
jgi:ribosome-associated protein